MEILGYAQLLEPISADYIASLPDSQFSYFSLDSKAKSANCWGDPIGLIFQSGVIWSICD
jgi:hypothetical protein